MIALRIERPNKRGVFCAHAQRYPFSGWCDADRRHHAVRVGIIWQLHFVLVCVLRIQTIHKAPQLRHRLDFVISKIGNKTRANICPVFIGDAARHRQIVARPGCGAKKRQCRRKEEKLDAALCVKSADLREDRKRRVVDHHAAVRVGLVLIVASGVKWPNNRRALQAVVLQSPVADHLVDVLRRVAVVGGELRLELIHKGVVLFGALALGVAPKVAVLCLRLGALMCADMDRLDLVHRETGQRGVERKAA